jgi:hypothetical protein
MPPMQISFPAQCLSQLPQCWAFCMVFTHRPLHTVKPPGQLHWALVQR